MTIMMAVMLSLAFITTFAKLLHRVRCSREAAKCRAQLFQTHFNEFLHIYKNIYIISYGSVTSVRLSIRMLFLFKLRADQNQMWKDGSVGFRSFNFILKYPFFARS